MPKNSDDTGHFLPVPTTHIYQRLLLLNLNGYPVFSSSSSRGSSTRYPISIFFFSSFLHTQSAVSSDWQHVAPSCSLRSALHGQTTIYMPCICDVCLCFCSSWALASIIVLQISPLTRATINEVSHHFFSEDSSISELKTSPKNCFI